MILDFYSFYLVVAPFGPTERPAGLCFINKKYLDGTTRVGGILSAGKVCSWPAKIMLNLWFLSVIQIKMDRFTRLRFSGGFSTINCVGSYEGIQIC